MESMEVRNFSIINCATHQGSEIMSNEKEVNRPSSLPHTNSKEPKWDSVIERGKYVYDLINGWIENADNKVSISCAVLTGVFGIITFLAERFKVAQELPVTSEVWNCIYKVSFTSSLTLISLAILYYIKAIIPNLKSNNKNPSEKRFPIYYGDIQELAIEDYMGIMKKSTDEDFAEELFNESWYNSRICMSKMRNYRRGVILSGIAIGLSIISLVAGVMMH